MKSSHTLFLAIIASFSLTLQSFSMIPAGFVPDPKGGTIQGKVIDSESNKPMEYVNVAIFNCSDSSLVTGTITSESGDFKVDKLPHGEYYLRITFLGFDRKMTGKIAVSPKTPVNDLGTIQLYTSASNLGEVSVVGEKAKVEYQIDKRVINVDQSTVSKGGSAVNVLENNPPSKWIPKGM